MGGTREASATSSRLGPVGPLPTGGWLLQTWVVAGGMEPRRAGGADRKATAPSPWLRADHHVPPAVPSVPSPASHRCPRGTVADGTRSLEECLLLGDPGQGGRKDHSSSAGQYHLQSSGGRRLRGTPGPHRPSHLERTQSCRGEVCRCCCPVCTPHFWNPDPASSREGSSRTQRQAHILPPSLRDWAPGAPTPYHLGPGPPTSNCSPCTQPSTGPPPQPARVPSAALPSPPQSELGC